MGAITIPKSKEAAREAQVVTNSVMSKWNCEKMSAYS